MKIQHQTDRLSKVRQQLLRQEAAIGGQLFGPIPPRGSRYFFRMNGHTWIWHEEWTDPQTKQRRIVNTRYELRNNGILKAQNGQNLRYIDSQEAVNLYQAIKMYCQRVSSEVYGRPVSI
ncbi:MAG TPA: hypothetical protein VMR18_03230 [Candidatus Saccharimonadales bacterium]|nr:hypothetical protein [Candidatus Saccharimonadales bacterium]